MSPPSLVLPPLSASAATAAASDARLLYSFLPAVAQAAAASDIELPSPTLTAHSTSSAQDDNVASVYSALIATRTAAAAASSPSEVVTADVRGVDAAYLGALNFASSVYHSRLSQAAVVGSLPGVQHIELDTRLGSGNLIHGALAAGSSAAAFVSGLSIPVLLPSILAIAAASTTNTSVAGKPAPSCVFHVWANKIDESDSTASKGALDSLALLRNAGIVLIGSGSTAQEAHDMAVVAHIVSSALGGAPVVHHFSADKFASQRETVRLLTSSQLDKLTANFLAQVSALPANAAATASDCAFATQATQSKIVELALAAISDAKYKPIEFHTTAAGSTSTITTVVVTEGSDYAVAASALTKEDVGVVGIRVAQPFFGAAFAAAIPSSVTKIAVVAPSGQSGSIKAHLHAALIRAGRRAAIVSVQPEDILSYVTDVVEDASSTATATASATATPPPETAAASVEDGSEELLIAPGTFDYQPSRTQLFKALAFPEAYETRHALSTAVEQESHHKLHTIKVTTNTRLTPVEYERNVFHLEFDTTGTDFKYEIGDALGVHGQNDPAKVLDFLRKYGSSGNVNVDPDQLITVSHPATKADYSGERFESRSALYLFTRVLDLFGRPSKRFYEQLAHYAADPAEKEKLLHLVSKEGADELKERVARTVDHADLLLEFTSARPSLAHLSSLIPAIKPRHYSIASSMKVHPGSVHLLVVLVDWKIPGTNEVRYGQCTRYLVNLQPGDNVVVSVKPSVMKLPPDHRQPVIMAGLGTGMAPFRAFVEERFWLREQGHEVGPMALYFGSRYRASEYLYGDELEAYNHDGLLTYLRLAFSRDPGSVGPDGKKKTYIQHKMQDDSELLHDLLLKQNGAFYLCGPTWPAPDVRDALLDSFSTHGGITRDQAIVELGKLKKEERYVLEVY